MFHINDCNIKNYSLGLPIIPVNYIISTGSQYINTGYAPNNNTEIEIKFNMRAVSSSYHAIFGSRTDISVNNFSFFHRASSTVGNKIFGFRNELIMKDVKGMYQTDVIAHNEANILYVTDGIDTITMDHSVQTFTGTYPMYLFGLNFAGGIDSRTAMWLYYCKIWEFGVLKRHFIPCIYKGTEVVGLWDTVTFQFFPSQVGVFTYA